MSRPPVWRRMARGLVQTLKLYRAFWLDAHAYLRGSGLLFRARAGAREARILKTAHRLDKGLALPEPRPDFGRDARTLLRRELQTGAHPMERQPWAHRIGHAALERHHAHRVKAEGVTQVTEMDRLQWRRWAQGPLEQAVKARRSIRQYEDRPVQAGLIARAVALARCSPSVCNRSAARAWVSFDRTRIAELLKWQNGNDGFGHQAHCLMIVSVNPAVFDSVGERHQGWIDGGLFAMTLMYALHRYGLGTCCLNWSVEPRIDRAFKKAAGLPADEMVVMLLMVGHPRTPIRVAISPRRPLRQTLMRLDDPPTAQGIDSCTST